MKISKKSIRKLSNWSGSEVFNVRIRIPAYIILCSSKDGKGQGCGCTGPGAYRGGGALRCTPPPLKIFWFFNYDAELLTILHTAAIWVFDHLARHLYHFEQNFDRLELIFTVLNRILAVWNRIITVLHGILTISKAVSPLFLKAFYTPPPPLVNAVYAAAPVHPLPQPEPIDKLVNRDRLQYTCIRLRSLDWP